jgi:single-strand DNA-binding protein
MKQITITGNIGKDAVIRATQAGDKVTSWSVAVEERNGQEKRSIWFDCNWWGRRGESLAQYLTKGGKVSVAGELSTREHEGKTYLTVNVDRVTLAGGKPEGDRDGYQDQRDGTGRPPTGGAGGVNDMDDSGIPF